MTKLHRIAATILLPIASLAWFEAKADTTYEFDSISAFILGRSPAYVGGPDIPSVTGILRNSSTPTTLEFRTNDDYINLCVPMLLTMLEKPGRYYLSWRISTPEGTPLAGSLIHCGLVLRN